MGDKSVVGPILLGAAITGATGLCLYMLIKKEKALALRPNSEAQVCIEMRISQDNIGLVLGLQGSNLREIQSRSNTRICLVPELETQDYKVANISGSADDVQFAEILIHQTITAQPRLVNCVVNIPKFAASSLLGRKGESLRDIERASRCRVESSKIDDGGGVRVTLQGTNDQVSAAEFLIKEKVKEQEYIQNKPDSSKRGGRIEYEQPLFLKYEDEEPEQSPTHSTQEDLRSTGSDHLLQVYVSCIADPSRLWVQNVGPGSVQLDKLTETMTEYYSTPSNQKFHAVDDLSIGDIIVATFSGDSNYYRAKVVRVDPDEYDRSKSLVDLDFVDYGDYEVKEMTEIFSIKAEFLKLKFQAVQCKLANVRPLEGDMNFSEECIAELERLTHCALWKPVLAKLMSQDVEDKGDNVVLELFQPSSSGDKNIGQELAKAGLVRYK